MTADELVSLAQQQLDQRCEQQQRRLEEAWKCRVIGYWVALVGIIDFALIALAVHVFSFLPPDAPAIGWALFGSGFAVVCGTIFVAAGAAEAY